MGNINNQSAQSPVTAESIKNEETSDNSPSIKSEEIDRKVSVIIVPCSNAHYKTEGPSQNFTIPLKKRPILESPPTSTLRSSNEVTATYYKGKGKGKKRRKELVSEEDDKSPVKRGKWALFQKISRGSDSE